MRSLTAIVALFAVSAATTAVAQDMGETTREVVGFTPDGKVAVRATSQGELLVDGTAKSYWFEIDEAWSPKLGTPESRHRRGEPNGAEHPTWDKADAEPLTIESWSEGSSSPDGKHLLVTVTNTSKRAGDRGWVCTTIARTILMSRDSRAAFNVSETSATGEPATRESGADCPRAITQPGWSSDGKQFLVERRIDGSFGFVTGSIDATGDFDQAPLTTEERFDPLGNLPVGPARTAWEAILESDITGARSALSGDFEETARTTLALAWAAGRAGDGSTAKKLARKVERDVSGDPIGLAMLGGAYALAGDDRRVKRTLNKALKSSDDWTTHVRMALLLEDVDLSLFNQILVYGLSSESGKANAEPWAWRTLIDGLVDAGLAGKGRELLGRMPEDSPARAGAEARLAIADRDGSAAREGSRRLLWADIGNCDGYLLAGRAELVAGAPADAIPLLDAALFCDPNAAEAAYFLSELHRSAGEIPRALAAARAYLKAAPPRRNDDVRDARRARIAKVVERLDAPGLALVTLTCRPLGRAFLCRGTVSNNSKAPIEGVTAQILDGATVLAESTLDTIEPESVRSFGVRVEKLDGARFELGRTPEERELNTVEALKIGW